MTREQEILSRAMSFLDDDLIADAHGPRKKLRHFLPTMIAACLVLAVVISFPFVREMINEKRGEHAPAEPVLPEENENSLLSSGWNTDPDLPPPALGDTVRVGNTAITLTDYTEDTATLTVVKSDDVPLYMAMQQVSGGILASTEPGFTDNGTILRPAQLKLYVNGADEWVDDLPHAAGTYTVIVNFNALYKSDYVYGEFLILYSYFEEDRRIVKDRILFRGKAEESAADTSVNETTPETPWETAPETDPETLP